MLRPAFGFDDDTQRAFGRNRLMALGRFAVDQKTIAVRNRIRGLRAIAPVLFANQIKQPDVRQAFVFQLLRREDLGGDHAFGVARAASVNVLLVFAETDEWRHGVHVR